LDLYLFYADPYLHQGSSKNKFYPMTTLLAYSKPVTQSL
jgi:hypothetical protein